MRNPAIDAYLQTNSPSLSGALTSWRALMNMKATYYAAGEMSDEELEAFIDYFDDGRISIQDRACIIPVKNMRDLLEKAKLASLFFDEMARDQDMFDDDRQAPLTAAEARSLHAMLAAICADLERLAAPAAAQDPSTVSEGAL